MKSHRKVTPIIALLAMLSAALPAAAQASSLLSGYGGPGQGNQAILGSGLVNGASGGGGGPAGGAPAAVSAASVAAPAGQAGAGSSAARHRHGPAAHGYASKGAGAQLAAPGPSAAYSQAVSARPAADSGVLGLSGTGLLILLLALATLLFSGLLMRGLARSTGTRRHVGS
jgi:hypothetical protein